MVSRTFLTLFGLFSETVFDVVNQETDKMELKKGTRINMSHIGTSEYILRQFLMKKCFYHSQ